MAFVPIPVESEDERDKQQSELRRVGYRLMDSFLQDNSLSDPAVQSFLSLLHEQVAANIIAHPTEARYRRLKKASNAYAKVRNVKHAEKLMDFLGFRDRVEEFEQWAVLPDTVSLDDFKGRLALIKDQCEKKLQAKELAKKASKEKEEEDRKHKELLLKQLEERRKEK